MKETEGYQMRYFFHRMEILRFIAVEIIHKEAQQFDQSQGTNIAKCVLFKQKNNKNERMYILFVPLLMYHVVIAMIWYPV